MTRPAKSPAELVRENAELTARLEEAEETLRAIRAGEVDALVMGEEVYTLRGAETPYRVLIEQMYEGAGTLLEDGTVLYANRRLGELLQIPLESLVGTSLRRFLAPPELPGFDNLLAEAKQRSGKGEFTFQRQDGSALPVLLSVSVASERDARPICVVATDLTERKRAEEALRQAHDSLEQRVNQRTAELEQASRSLRESEAQFRAMFDRHQAVEMVIEPETGAILRANEAAARFYGYPPERLCAMRIQEINRLPAEEVAAERHQAAAERRSFFVFPHRLASGEIRWVEVYSTPVQLQGRTLLYSIVHDITPRKQAEEAVRESEARYRLLVEQTVDGIFVADAQGRYVDVNSAGAAMLGYTREEILRLSLVDLLAEDELPRLPAAVAAYAGGAVVRSEWRFRRKDGSLFPGEIMGRQLPDGRLQGILRDITERKRTEEALRKTSARDAFLVALADALRPLATVHEIKTAATRMLGQHLRASRVAYAEVTTDGEVIIERGYADGVSDIPGRYRLDDYGPALLPQIRAGRNVIVADVASASAYTAQEKARYAAVQVVAHLNVPLLKGGRPVALLAVHQAAPRAWTDEEVLLVQETVERTWATVERARAEHALQTSYKELESFNKAMVGRELRMIELKKEVDELCARFGQRPRYGYAAEEKER
jgi:PAS domain S-box-containing protein